MLELQGKFGTAKVFTDVVDNESISQVINLLNQPYIEGSKVRMMPDIHAGAGCTIGTTMTIKDKICPNLVGVDIGCGMETIRIKETHIEPQKLDKVIRAGVPSGFEIRTEAHRYAEDADGKPIMIFKNPKTDTGHFKKSQRGCCRVAKTGDGYDYVDGLTWAEAQDSNELRTVFRDGKFEKQFTLDEVRKNLHGGTF